MDINGITCQMQISRNEDGEYDGVLSYEDTNGIEFDVVSGGEDFEDLISNLYAETMDTISLYAAEDEEEEDISTEEYIDNLEQRVIELQKKVTNLEEELSNKSNRTNEISEREIEEWYKILEKLYDKFPSSKWTKIWF